MSFAQRMDEFEDEHGFRYEYIIALFEGEVLGPPTTQDAKNWADDLGLTSPVLADTGQVFPLSMPYDAAIPVRCVLTPDMQMLGCYEGHPPEGARDPSEQVILDHRAQAAP